MIRRTFQLAPGVGPWRERDLWARGIDSWERFPAPEEPQAVSREIDAKVRQRIAHARAALDARDLASLARLLPAREHWRCYAEFAEDAVFFDIETDSRDLRHPTVVSLFHAEGLEVFISGRNLDALPAALARWPLWVTFNGACYDVPILRGEFSELRPPALHIDLRVLMRRLRFSGGLKAIEDTLGIARPRHLLGANGHDAVLLWRAYQRTGDIEALRFLVEYNLYDAFQLRSVMEHGYNLAADELACEITPLRPFDRGDILYDVSRLLLDIAPTALDEDILARVRAAEEQPGSPLSA